MGVAWSLENHGSKYTPEQLNAWAHMIHMTKHESYEYLPNMPFLESLASLPVNVYLKARDKYEI